MAEAVDIAIVGAGPAGLAAACAALRAGAKTVIVLDREAEAGGIPRSCAHSPFGMREFHRVLGGRAYAKRLVEQARREGADIRTGVHVVRLDPGGAMAVSTSEGMSVISARRVILATGARETPRPARLIPGERPFGVMTTGALQNFVHIEKRKPFEQPAIVGTELVGFSAILTALLAGMRPAAMIERADAPVARWPSALLPKALHIPLILGAEIADIVGREQVEAIVVKTAQGARRVDCDGVVFTGRFTPAAELVRQSHLAFDPATGGPIIDQFGRCSDSAYFAAGNLLRPIETAGWSWAEGSRVGEAAMRDLMGRLPPAPRRVTVSFGRALSYVVPQLLTPLESSAGLGALQMRASRAGVGHLTLSADGLVLARRRVSARLERRILLPLAGLRIPSDASRLLVSLEEA